MTAVGVILALAIGGTFAAVQLSGAKTPVADYGGQAADSGLVEDPVPVPPAETTTEPAWEQTTEPTGESAETDPADIEAAAIAELEQIHDQDLPTMSFTGQYAAQISSKYPGIVDDLQTTESGSHTFGAGDILSEHQRLRANHSSDEHPIVLLKSIDYGKRQMIGSEFLWVTFAVGDFPDRQAVVSWCDRQFADLTETERGNQCAVRKLEPGR